MGLVALWSRIDEGVQFVVEESKTKQSSSRNAGRTCPGAQVLWVTSIRCACFNYIQVCSHFYSANCKDWTYPSMPWVYCPLNVYCWDQIAHLNTDNGLAWQAWTMKGNTYLFYPKKANHIPKDALRWTPSGKKNMIEVFIFSQLVHCYVQWTIELSTDNKQKRNDVDSALRLNCEISPCHLLRVWSPFLTQQPF